MPLNGSFSDRTGGDELHLFEGDELPTASTSVVRQLHQSDDTAARIARRPQRYIESG
jgi:hypothetical protein